MPHGQEFATVGHLYRGIERGLGTLADASAAGQHATATATQLAAHLPADLLART